MSTIDFKKAIQDAKGASFEALPIGDYDIEVTKSEATTSSTGKPMIKTTFKVTSGPYEKRPIMNQFVLSLENPQAVAIFFRHMKAFGLTEEFFASIGQVQSLEPVASALMGRRARVSLGQREWQGEMRNEVKGVKPYTGAPPQAAPAGPGAALPPRTGPVAPGPATPIAPPQAAAAPLAPAPAPGVPQVQSMPQPPAPVAAPEPPPVAAAVENPTPVASPQPSPAPTATPSSEPLAGIEANGSAPTEPTAVISDAAQPAPPALPF